MLPSVLMYALVLVLEPSERKYKDPFAADRLGAPEPKNTPKFDVLENLRPTPAVPPAGIAVASYTVVPRS